MLNSGPRQLLKGVDRRAPWSYQETKTFSDNPHLDHVVIHAALDRSADAERTNDAPDKIHCQFGLSFTAHLFLLGHDDLTALVLRFYRAGQRAPGTPWA